MKLPSNLQTGDIVLFSGRCLISNIIKLFTLCRWSHVGMIIIDDRYNEPLLYESTHNDSIPCIDLGFKTQGVQVVRLADRVKQYNGDVGIRRLRMAERNDTVRYKLRLLRMALIGRPFEKLFMQAFAALFKINWIDEDLDSLFCSKKVAKCYIECGWLSKKAKAHHYTQADFARNIKLENGYLTKIQVIKNGK